MHLFNANEKQARGHGSESIWKRSSKQEQETEHAHDLLCATSFLKIELLICKLYRFSQDTAIQTANVQHSLSYIPVIINAFLDHSLFTYPQAFLLIQMCPNPNDWKMIPHWTGWNQGEECLAVCVFVLQCGKVIMLSAFYPEVPPTGNTEKTFGHISWQKKGDVSKLRVSFRLPVYFIFQMTTSLCWGGCLLCWHRVCTSAGIIYGGNTQLFHQANIEAQELTKRLNGFVGY